MKYCDKCGAQLDDGARFCPSCGANLDSSKVDYDFVGNNNNNGNQETNKNATYVGIASIITTFICSPLIGLILSIIGLCLASKNCDGSGKTLNVIGLILSIIFLIIQIFVIVIVFAGGVVASGANGMY